MSYKGTLYILEPGLADVFGYAIDRLVAGAGVLRAREFGISESEMSSIGAGAAAKDLCHRGFVLLRGAGQFYTFAAATPGRSVPACFGARVSHPTAADDLAKLFRELAERAGGSLVYGEFGRQDNEQRLLGNLGNKIPRPLAWLIALSHDTADSIGRDVLASIAGTYKSSPLDSGWLIQLTDHVDTRAAAAEENIVHALGESAFVATERTRDIASLFRPQ